MIIIPARGFKKKIAKLPKNIRLALAERLRLFVANQFNPILNNHPLHGAMRQYRSINITGDWRLIFEQCDGDTLRLIDIDTHANLYGT